MSPQNLTRGIACGLALALVLGAGVTTAAVESRIDDVVRVENVQSNGDVVSGRLVNETGDALENVRLVVSDQFLWRNERHPGDNSPSDAHTITVPGPVPPHGSVTFEFRRPSPLPERSDGDFTTDVTPVELTRQPLATGSYERTYERHTYYGPDREHREDVYSHDHSTMLDGR